MKILFIHQNFPGQFVHLARDLGRNTSHQVVALGLHNNPVPAGVTLRLYQLLRGPANNIHPLLGDTEAKVLRAEACAAAALKLRDEGFLPDLIIAHPGWGEAMFIKDVFPAARLANYCEFFYASEGQDVGFDPEAPSLNFERRYVLRLKNTANLLSLNDADLAYAPTAWQRSTYPLPYQDRIDVIHDGINTAELAFRKNARIQIQDSEGRLKVSLSPGDEVLTFVARNLEPVRGFHVFMRALPKILKNRPKAQVIIVGGNDVSYGHRAAHGKTWKEQLLAEVEAVDGGINLDRVHFAGRIPYNIYLDLLSISKVHVYWTTPFVLSWSFLECAMAGVPMIASRTPPVEEFAAQFDVTLVDFFDKDGLANAAIERLHSVWKPHRLRALAQFSIEDCVKRLKIHLGISH